MIHSFTAILNHIKIKCGVLFIILSLLFTPTLWAEGNGYELTHKQQEEFKIPDSLYRLSRKNFHIRYDFDDTAHALIDFAFNQREAVVGLITQPRKKLFVRLTEYQELRVLEPTERKQVLKTMDKSRYKLSRNQFLQKYGADDSLKALINIFFNDRILGWVAAPVYPALIMIPGLFNNATDVRYYTTHGYMSENGSKNLFFGQYYSTGSLVFLGSVAGIYVLTTTLKKDLAYYIDFYNKNGYLHHRFHERIINRIDRQKTDELIRKYKEQKQQDKNKDLLKELQEMQKKP